MRSRAPPVYTRSARADSALLRLNKFAAERCSCSASTGEVSPLRSIRFVPAVAVPLRSGRVPFRSIADLWLRTPPPPSNNRIINNKSGGCAGLAAAIMAAASHQAAAKPALVFSASARLPPLLSTPPPAYGQTCIVRAHC